MRHRAATAKVPAAGSGLQLVSAVGIAMLLEHGLQVWPAIEESPLAPCAALFKTGTLIKRCISGPAHDEHWYTVLLQAGGLT